jgi:uncharacterized protein YegJ (DUF2314 family)
MTITLIILGTIAAGLIWWFYFRVPRPEIPPLTVDEDDPLMIEAIKTAKETIGDFVKLYGQDSKNAQVKIPFKTSSGETEFLWAEVKAINDSGVDVFLLTPPVTHTGQVDRNQTYRLDDIKDWAIFLDNGKVIGGHTMKVMFKIARDKWGQLPDKLLEEEKKYS